MRGLALFFLAALLSAEDAGKIMRPADKAAMPSDQVDIVATAPAGRLELDGKVLEAEKPFPNVLHLSVKAAAGEHLLALIWDGGRKDVHFFVGPNPPAGYDRFRQHPPVARIFETWKYLSRAGCEAIREVQHGNGAVPFPRPWE